MLRPAILTALLFGLVCFASALGSGAGSSRAPRNAHEEKYDVIWDTPSRDAAGSMPIGNGEVCLNAWVEEATGDLLFYIGRTDSLSEVSRMLKLGRIRVHFSPKVLLETGFKQQIHLHDGEIEFRTNGGDLHLFVDSGSNTIFLRGHFNHPVGVSLTNESWRLAPHKVGGGEEISAWSAMGAPEPLIESADQFFSDGNHAVGWFHRNETSIVPVLWEEQSLTGLNGAFDPLIHRTFGGKISSVDLTANTETSLYSPDPIQDFTVQITTESFQARDTQEWKSKLESDSRAVGYGQAHGRTTRHWHDFWDRSWFTCSNDAIGRGYNLQRYVQACQSPGTYPTKFNGGTYTVEPQAMGRSFNPDYRAWGDAVWFQNVRHMQHPMLASGDFEQMEPFFKLYESVRALSEARSKFYHKTEGAYFPETMTVFGTYAGSDYGWKRDGHTPDDVQSEWWRYAWNQGLELVALMLDRWEYTQDREFLKQRVLPMAESVLKYFDTRFLKDAKGHIILDPTQSVETYWHGVINDMPSSAGLIAVTEELNGLHRSLTTAEQRRFFAHMKEAAPALPIHDGRLAPAQTYDPGTSNVENPELYAVWPFKIVSLLKPKYLAEGRAAYEKRLFHQDVGWGYDGNAAALLGLTEEAARILVKKCANSHPGYRWPATWGPNFDWLPDQNHGGNLLNTADLMLLQTEPMELGGKILVLPAWPKNWDVSFKLHAPGNTTVTVETKNGKITKLDVNPRIRGRDVVLGAGWK